MIAYRTLEFEYSFFYTISNVDKDYFIKGAWASATDTLSVEIYNSSGGNIDAAAFNVSYITKPPTRWTVLGVLSSNLFV
jgi:hypothetical protein